MHPKLNFLFAALFVLIAVVAPAIGTAIPSAEALEDLAARGLIRPGSLSPDNVRKFGQAVESANCYCARAPDEDVQKRGFLDRFRIGTIKNPPNRCLC